MTTTAGIHLFCNERYGRALLDTAVRFARARGARLRVVLSATAAGRLRRAISAQRRRRRLGVPVAFAADVNDQRFGGSIEPGDHGVVAGFNQIFRRPAIARFATLVNVHPSILPMYRGPVPSHWCLANGETATGFTLHEITARIDDGPILHQQVVPILPGDDETILDRRIADAAGPVLWRYLDHLATGDSWRPMRVDAAAVYRAHVDYATFPGARNGSCPRACTTCS